MMIDVLGMLVMMAIIFGAIAIIWQTPVNKYGISYWEVSWRIGFTVGLASLFIYFVAIPLGLGGW